METKEINKAIAAMDGWEFCERSRTRYGKPEAWAIEHCRHRKHTFGRWARLARLPDFMNSLDAIRPIELKARNRCDVFRYDHYLAITIAKRRGLSHPSDVDTDDLVLASAADRAETCPYILTNFKPEA